MKIHASLALGIGLMSATVFSANADNAFVLAQSKSRKLQIIANGGDRWCQSLIRLQMVLEEGSPDSDNPASQISVMNLLRTPIEAECKTAVEAELKVSGPGATQGSFKASKAGGWVFAAAPSAPVSNGVAASLDTPTSGAAPTSSSQPKLPSQRYNHAMSFEEMDGGNAYVRAFLNLVQSNPLLAKENNVACWWANRRFRNEIDQFRGQELKIQRVLEKAQDDLLTTPAASDYITIYIKTDFLEYDRNKNVLPIRIANNYRLEGDNTSYRCRMPSQFNLTVDDFNFIGAIPMTLEEAERFIERRAGRYGTVNRSLLVVATIKLDISSLSQADRDFRGAGTIEHVDFLHDKENKLPIYQLSATDLSKMRADAEARRKIQAEEARLKLEEAQRQQEEQQRLARIKFEEEQRLNKIRLEEQQRELEKRRLIEQRNRYIQAASALPETVRMANWVADAKPQAANIVDASVDLASLRTAKAIAMIKGTPIPVTMLIQSESQGRTGVETRWPGMLRVSVPDGQPSLESSGWYLVHGKLGIQSEAVNAPLQLDVTRMYACVVEKCGEAADATALVDRQLSNTNVVP